MTDTPTRAPTGADLDQTLSDLGRAHLALSGIRCLIHAQSTRRELHTNEDAVCYLLEKRDAVLDAIDAALIAYAAAADPDGPLAALIADTVGFEPSPVEAVTA